MMMMAVFTLQLTDALHATLLVYCFVTLHPAPPVDII